MVQVYYRTIGLLRRVGAGGQGPAANPKRFFVPPIEYGFLASLIALAAMQALSGLGSETAQTYNTTGDKLAEQRARQTAGDDGGNADQSNPDEPVPLVGDQGTPMSNGNADEPATAAGLAAPEM